MIIINTAGGGFRIRCSDQTKNLNRRKENECRTGNRHEKNRAEY